jgi:hypothetical protein
LSINFVNNWDGSGVTEITDLGLFSGRRLRPEELVDVVRRRTGVQLLAGFERLVEARGQVAYDGMVPIASASHLTDAYLIRQQPGAELVWETGRVGEHAGGNDVVLIFPMAMGNGSPLPQPAGQFDLYLNDRRVLAFTLTKDSQRWLGEGCSLYFDVRLIRATTFGASLTHDELLREEAVFVDGMALLRVAPELLPPGRPARLRVVPVQRRPSRRWFRRHARPGRHLPQRLAGRHDRAQRPPPGAHLAGPDPPGSGDLSYFAKITRADHECAWTSPIWINRH